VQFSAMISNGIPGPLLPHLVDNPFAMSMLDQLIVAPSLLERDVSEKHHEDHHCDNRDVIGNGQDFEKLLKPGDLHNRPLAARRYLHSDVPTPLASVNFDGPQDADC